MQADRFGLMPISSANVATWWEAEGQASDENLGKLPFHVG